MATIALTSPSGAPGVTTTAVALATIWPRPVLLLEADITGGSSILAGYLRGMIEHRGGLLALLSAQASGTRFIDAVHQAGMKLPGAPSVVFVPTITRLGQGQGLDRLWPGLANDLAALEQAGTDVIVDAGRLGTAHGPAPLLYRADVVLMLGRSHLPAITAAMTAGPALAEALDQYGTGRDALRLVTVGEGQPHSGREIAAAVGIHALSSLAWDPAHAEHYSLGASIDSKRLARANLTRSVAELAQGIQNLIQTRRNFLGAAAASATSQQWGGVQ